MSQFLSIKKLIDFNKRNIVIVAGIRMIYFTTLIICVFCLVHLNEGLNYDDIQHSNSKDLAKEDKIEFYGSNEIYSDESGKNIKLCQPQAFFHRA